jgi:hypothetical protein
MVLLTRVEAEREAAPSPSLRLEGDVSARVYGPAPSTDGSTSRVCGIETVRPSVPIARAGGGRAASGTTAPEPASAGGRVEKLAIRTRARIVNPGRRDARIAPASGVADQSPLRSMPSADR